MNLWSKTQKRAVDEKLIRTLKGQYGSNHIVLSPHRGCRKLGEWRLLKDVIVQLRTTRFTVFKSLIRFNRTIPVDTVKGNIFKTPWYFISRLGCKMFCLRKHRKRKYDVCSFLGKIFCYYSSCPSTEDYLFDEPTIKKMRQDHKHSEGKKQQYSKNTYSADMSYKGRHYKGKTYDNRPSQQQQSYKKRNNNQGYKQRN